MKKIIQSLLVATLALSNVSAKVYTSKNFLMPRTSLSNNSTVMGMGQQKSAKKKGFGAHVSVAGFYRESHNDTDIAKYFGGGTPADSANQNGTIEVAKPGAATTNALFGQDVDNGTADKSIGGVVNLKPVRKEYGAQVRYRQCLSTFVDGLWLSVDAPIVEVKTNMGATVSNAVANTQDAAADGQHSKTLADFFDGVALGKTAFKQDALKYAQLDNADHKSGVQVADISVRLGYDFLKDADYSVGGNVNVVIPTGNDLTGVDTYEAFAGKAGAFQIGAALNAKFNLWRSADKKSELDFNFGADYRYSLEKTQKRVVGMYNHAKSYVSPGGRYVLLIQDNVANMKPAANLLLQDVKAEGGSHIDVDAGFSYSFNQFGFDIGYNLTAQDSESVKLVNAWAKDKVALVNYGQKMDAAAALTNTNSYSVLQPEGTKTTGIASASSLHYVYPTAAATPAQLTHKVAAKACYRFDMATPVSISAFGEYEFGSTDNTAPESWMVGGCVGVCF